MCTAKDPFVLHCVFVEDGLGNIEIGVMSFLPTEGSAVSADSYTVCGQHSGSVTVAEEIMVDCVATARYLVIRSSGTAPAKLCMAEVAMYGPVSAVSTQREYWCNNKKLHVRWHSKSSQTHLDEHYKFHCYCVIV